METPLMRRFGIWQRAIDRMWDASTRFDAELSRRLDTAIAIVNREQVFPYEIKIARFGTKASGHLSELRSFISIEIEELASREKDEPVPYGSIEKALQFPRELSERLRTLLGLDDTIDVVCQISHRYVQYPSPPPAE